MKIGFIGVGVMGHAIVKHLLAKGHALTLYTRTKAKAEDLLAEGAHWAQSPQEVTEQADVIFSMVGYPQDVEQIYLGPEGLFKASVSGKIFVDLTTSTPSLAEKLALAGEKMGAHVLDAPVSGGDVGAQKGILTMMVGGDLETFEQIRPILEVFTAKINYFGGPGKGQHAKMANQIMIAGTMTGMCELLAYAQAAQLDPALVLDTVSSGSAANWSLSNYGPRVLRGDLAPGFYAKHFLKDLKIALDEADKMGLDLPGTQTAKQVYQKLVDAGFGDLGTQALYKIYQ